MTSIFEASSAARRGRQVTGDGADRRTVGPGARFAVIADLVLADGAIARSTQTIGTAPAQRQTMRRYLSGKL